MRVLLVICVLFIASSAQFFNGGAFSDSPAPDFRKILPKEVSQAYQGLNAEEKQALKDVFRNYRSYRNEQEFIAALKQRSPSLGARAEQKMQQLHAKVAGLSEESQGFVKNLVASGRELYSRRLNGEQIDRSEMRQVGMGVMQHYRSLSPYSQQELQQAFPEVFKFMAQVRAQGMRGMMQRFFGGGMGKK